MRPAACTRRPYRPALRSSRCRFRCCPGPFARLRHGRRSVLRSVHRSGGEDQASPVIEVGFVELIAVHQVAELPAGRRVGQLRRGHHDTRRFVLEEIPAIGLAGFAGDPKMPRMSSRSWNASPQRRRIRQAGPACARRSRPSLRRSPRVGARCSCRTSALPLPKPLHRGQVAYIHCEIGELAYRQLGAHGVVAGPRPIVSGDAGDRCSQHLLSPDQAQVAQQDGGRFAEPA